jgi:hypothetical protein
VQAFATIIRLPVVGTFLGHLLYAENQFYKLRKCVYSCMAGDARLQFWF